MTGTNDKLLGLLLAVLMVTSVFAGTIAFAGTAAAASDSQFVDLTNADIGSDGVANVPEGQQVQHTH